MPGKNCFPIHLNCHCTTAPNWYEKEYEGWMNFIGKGGATEEWEILKRERNNLSSLKISIPDNVYKRSEMSSEMKDKINKAIKKIENEYLVYID